MYTRQHKASLPKKYEQDAHSLQLSKITPAAALQANAARCPLQPPALPVHKRPICRKCKVQPTTVLFQQVPKRQKAACRCSVPKSLPASPRASQRPACRQCTGEALCSVLPQREARGRPSRSRFLFAGPPQGRYGKRADTSTQAVVASPRHSAGPPRSTPASLPTHKGSGGSKGTLRQLRQQR